MGEKLILLYTANYTSFIRSFTHSLTHTFIHSFIHHSNDDCLEKRLKMNPQTVPYCSMYCSCTQLYVLSCEKFLDKRGSKKIFGGNLPPECGKIKAPIRLGYREGCPSPSRSEVCEASWAPPAGSRVELQVETHFGVFWRPQNATSCTYISMLSVRQTLFHFTVRGKVEV